MSAGQTSGPIYRDTARPHAVRQRAGPRRRCVTSPTAWAGSCTASWAAGTPRCSAWTAPSPGSSGSPGRPPRPSTTPSSHSTDPNRLIAAGRAYPGWAGLCYVMAGLLAYKQGGYLRASELLQRGLTIRNDDDANQFASSYLTRVVTRVEVAERIEVPVLFSEEVGVPGAVALAAGDGPAGSGAADRGRAAAVAACGPGPVRAGPRAGTGQGGGGLDGGAAQLR